MSAPTLIPRGRIVGISFSVSGTEDVIAESTVPITQMDLYKGGQPYPGGLYDAHLGTTSHEYACSTCFNNKQNCPGHDGHLKLNQPLISPLFIDEIKKWLRIICFKCGVPVIDLSEYSKIPDDVRLDHISKNNRAAKKICNVCRTEHPSVSRDIERPLMLMAKYTTGNTVKLFPHMIEAILTKITDETVITLGKNIICHPRKFILRAIKIPPTAIRPDIRRVGSGRSSNNPLTVLLQEIVYCNDKLPQALPEVISEELEEEIFKFVDTYYAYVKGAHSKRAITAGGKSDTTSLAQGLKGKQGLFRKHMQGKRVKIVARTTISGDPRLKPDEIGVPIKFAKSLVIEEVVQEYNKARLMINFLNGKDKYPGCSKIIRKRTGTEHNIGGSHLADLEIGDILLRDLQDGDYVYFNRQPSLLPSALTAMRVVIAHDPEILTIRMNVTVCSLFNADFDGDQMNLFVGSNLASRIEIERHASVPNFFIKHANSAPLIGQADDSIIGSFLLTRSHVKFDKYHAMLLFSSTTKLPTVNSDQLLFSTRDITTAVMSDVPITYKGNTSYFGDGKLAPYYKYNSDDTKVEIVDGVHVKGVLDKSTVAKGKVGGYYHSVALKFGEKKALELIFNQQQTAINYLQQSGFSIGIKDILIDKTALARIHEIESSIIDRSLRLTERLDKCLIIPPVGESVLSFYERQQIEFLRIQDDFSAPIFSSVNPEVNNLAQLIMSGSKGTINHLSHISSSIGQIVIADQRPKRQLSFGRTFVHFPRFDMHPIANGFIINSYISGMDSDEFVANAMNARADFITKTLYTSATGESERKSVKNLESIMTNNFRMSVKYNSIVQLLYGETGIDSRRVAFQKLATVTPGDLSAWHWNPKVTSHREVFEREYATIVADRNEYRRLFMKIENGKFSEPFSDAKPFSFDVAKIYADVAAVGEAGSSDDELASKVLRVADYLEKFPYLYLNSSMEAAKKTIPTHIKTACWLPSMYIRSVLCASLALRHISMTQLELILQRVSNRFIRGFISYGTPVGILAALSFSEPLTQYMLDAHHRTTSGGTSKNAMTTVREILGAKPTEKLVAPTMVLTPINQENHLLHRLANSIEVSRVGNFVSLSQIFFEKFGVPVHKDYIEEKSLIEEFVKANPLLKPPNDLLRWCIRFVLDRIQMIHKNMPLETIIRALRENFPDFYFVYSGENSDKVILRVYIRGVYFDKHEEIKAIEEVRDLIIDMIVRGVKGVKSAKIEKIKRMTVGTDDSLVKSEINCVVTSGTNLGDAFLLEGFNPYNILTDAIEEIQNVLGIEAARSYLYTSIRNLGAGGLTAQHVTIFVDEMTWTGQVTSIERQGLSKREGNNVLLRMGFSAPIQTLQTAAINNMEDMIQGITSPLLVGDVPLGVGTAYNHFYINESIVKSNTISQDMWLENLKL